MKTTTNGVGGIINRTLRRNIEALGRTITDADIVRYGLSSLEVYAIRGMIVKKAGDRKEATCAQFPLDRWKALVQEGECRVGYWDWVRSMAMNDRTIGYLELTPEVQKETGDAN